MGTLDGKVALVTGGARGQGLSHAHALAKEGADVVLLDICDQIASVQYGLATEEDLTLAAKSVGALYSGCRASGRHAIIGIARRRDQRNRGRLRAHRHCCDQSRHLDSGGPCGISPRTNGSTPSTST